MRIHTGRILALTVILTLSAFARQGPKIHLTAVSPLGRWTDEQSAVLLALKNALEGKEAVLSDTVPEWTVVVDVLSLEPDKYIISYVLLRGLPEHVVDLARKNEVMYSQKKQHPREGKTIREMMSEEFIRQFGMPLDSHISVIKRDELAIYAGRFADDFLTRYGNK